MEFSSEIITSGQNKYVSEARMLEDKKRRDKSGLFRFDGVKLLCEAISRGVEIEYLLISDEKLDGVISKMMTNYKIFADDVNLRALIVKNQIFEKISTEKAPEGVICVAKYIDKFHKFAKINNEEILSPELFLRADDKILILESVRDPQNVGAIIRSASALGATAILMSDDCADIYNSKSVRASMGTMFGMKIIKTDNLCGCIKVLQSGGRRVFSATLDERAKKLGGFDVLPSDCILIGNEGHGLSSEIIRASDESVYIPMRMNVESMNAATAATVLLWEFFGRV